MGKGREKAPWGEGFVLVLIFWSEEEWLGKGGGSLGEAAGPGRTGGPLLLHLCPLHVTPSSAFLLSPGLGVFLPLSAGSQPWGGLGDRMVTQGRGHEVPPGQAAAVGSKVQLSSWHPKELTKKGWKRGKNKTKPKAPLVVCVWGSGLSPGCPLSPSCPRVAAVE